MQHEPFASSVIRSAGADPASGTRAGACRTHRLYRYLDVPPADGMALADAAAAGASFAAPIRHADACEHLVNLAGATHQQATPR
jgi:hypothetical protein